MATRSRQWLSVAASFLIAIPAIQVVAAGTGALRGMPAGYLDEHDLTLMQGAVVGVLEDGSEAARRTWSNSKNGHSGTVTALRAFQGKEGQACKKVQIDNSAEGYKSSMRYDICLHPDGNWREIESGVPFGKATDHKGSP
jgi:surface antigen